VLSTPPRLSFQIQRKSHFVLARRERADVHIHSLTTGYLLLVVLFSLLLQFPHQVKNNDPECFAIRVVNQSIVRSVRIKMDSLRYCSDCLTLFCFIGAQQRSKTSQRSFGREQNKKVACFRCSCAFVATPCFATLLFSLSQYWSHPSSWSLRLLTSPLSPPRHLFLISHCHTHTPPPLKSCRIGRFFENLAK